MRRTDLARRFGEINEKLSTVSLEADLLAARIQRNVNEIKRLLEQIEQQMKLVAAPKPLLRVGQSEAEA